MQDNEHQSIDNRFFESGRSWYHYKFTKPYNQLVYTALICIMCVISFILTLMATGKIFPITDSRPHIVKAWYSEPYVGVIKPLTKKRDIDANIPIRDFFIKKYVNAREGYNYQELVKDYGTIRALSGAQTYGEFVSAVDYNNPQAPARLYGRDIIKQISVKSININKKPDSNLIDGVAEYTANVKFLSELLTNGEQKDSQKWAANIDFTYHDTIVDQETHEVKPPKFIVKNYKVTKN